jgi:hypothetical protein
LRSIASLTDPFNVKARLAVASEHPALAATSWSVVKDRASLAG